MRSPTLQDTLAMRLGNSDETPGLHVTAKTLGNYTDMLTCVYAYTHISTFIIYIRITILVTRTRLRRIVLLLL